MADKKETKPEKRRTQVKEIPRNEKELSQKEQKKVKGGPNQVVFLPNIGRSGSNT